MVRVIPERFKSEVFTIKTPYKSAYLSLYLYL